MLKVGERARECRSVKVRHRTATDWLEPKPAGDRRWTSRSVVDLDAGFRPRWRRRFCVRVKNLSTHGCRLADPGHLVAGTYSWIILPTLESWYARVAWCDGAAAGLDFSEPLHRTVADMIIARAAIRAPAGALQGSQSLDHQLDQSAILCDIGWGAARRRVLGGSAYLVA
jgi:hypothetical protein